MKTFLADYNHNGSQWSVYLPAEIWADAQTRLARISLGGRVAGELMASMPATSGAGGLVRALCLIRNVLRPRRHA